MEQVKISEFITKNYTDYSVYCALHRVVPGIDGLIPAQRRIYMALNSIARGKLVGTLSAISETQSLHPFGDQSIDGTISRLARIGAIDGQGSFGVKLLEEVPGAAPRYTKVGLSEDRAEYYFGLADYVPQVEGEEKMEYAYLPVPIPYALMYGTFSWATGIQSRIPAFTYESLLEAYKHDDYNLLKAQYGYDIVPGKSDLKSLWETGVGRLGLTLKVTRVNTDTIDIIGSGEVVTPRIGFLNKWLSEGKILVKNMSKDKIYIRVMKAPRIRTIDMDEVHEACMNIAYMNRSHRIQVAYNGQLVTMGIRDWIAVTMALYNQAFSVHKTESLKKIDRDIEIYQILPKVGELVMQDKSDAQIIKALGITQEVLNSCLSRSISMLRKKDHDDRIANLQERRAKVENQTSDEMIQKMIGKL